MTPSTRRSLPLVAAAGALALVGVGAYSCSRHANGDHLSDQQAGTAASKAENATENAVGERARLDPATRCASGATYDLLKRELFRRAAEIRGRDDALFDRVATAASLRVERPVVRSRDEGLGSIACGASATVDLPPGLAVAGGRGSLAADLDYTLQPAADGTGDVITVTNADPITIPLATLGRSAASPTAAAPAPATTAADPLSPQSPSPQPAVPVPAPRPVPPASAPQAPAPPPVSRPTANPSFSCARARARGEIAICGDPGLAALDRRMAAQYAAAYAAADPDRRLVLRSTAHRFYGYRDVCPTARCIADGYRQRMAEIDDIMDSDRDPDH